jgi:hypothetical protein
MTNIAPYVKTTGSQLYIPNIFFKSGVEIAVACAISAEIIYRSKMYQRPLYDEYHAPCMLKTNGNNLYVGTFKQKLHMEYISLN